MNLKIIVIYVAIRCMKFLRHRTYSKMMIWIETMRNPTFNGQLEENEDEVGREDRKEADQVTH